MKKVCNKCKEEKEADLFAKRKASVDGLRTQCKECVNKYRFEWNHSPSGKKKRLAWWKGYYQSESGKEKILSSNKKFSQTTRGKSIAIKKSAIFKKENPEKVRAHWAVKNALRTGALTKQPCGRCRSTEKIHAHHESYDRPLNIVWLCAKHHIERHKELSIMI